MNVHVRSEWKTGTDLHEVYVYTRDEIKGRTVAARIVDGQMLWDVLEEGSIMSPTFTVPGVFIGALRDELNKLGPFSDSPVDWLRDTLVQRDRLMTIVEKLVP